MTLLTTCDHQPATLPPLPCIESNPDLNNHLGCNCPSPPLPPPPPRHLQVKIEPSTTTVELARCALLKLY
eukprot:9496840-Pyramimonas_sp.AAC.1